MISEIYQVRRPELKEFIAYYWLLECNDEGEESCDYLYPEPYFDIIFSFAGLSAFETGSGKKEEIENGFICGMRKECFRIRSTERVRYLAVRFYPQGIYPFLRVPLSEFTNQNIAITLTDVGYLRELEKEVQFLTDIDQIINKIEAGFIRFLGKSYLQYSYPLLKVLDNLLEIQRLNKIYTKRLQSRVIERDFQKWIGVSPKYFQRILRFNKAISAMNQYNAKESLSEFAQKHDYYDQSHMIKDFQQFLNMSPTEYLQLNM